MNRREFLRLGAALTVIGACDSEGGRGAPDGAGATPDSGADGGVDSGADAAPIDLATVPQSDALFPTAVVAGAMRADRVLLRGQTTLASVRVRIWAEAGVAHDAEVAADEGHVALEVDGLEPGTAYTFAFFQGDASRSPVGRFRTLPAAGTAVVTLGATSCTREVNMPYRSLSVLARQPIDAVCHLGDVSYNDTAETLAEYRNRWTTTLRDPGYRDLFGAAGTYLTWDDHEIAASDDLPTLPPARKAAGLQAFFEALPVPRGEGDRFWASYRHGESVEVFVLDCRGEREGDQYISRAQMDWLKQALLDSPCHFKVLLNSVPITAFPATWGFEGDRWQGYPAQREELLSHITDRDVRNVWFLTGDFHFGAVMRVEREGPRRRIHEILCGPGASRGNPAILLLDANPGLRERYLPVEQFPWYHGGHAATVLRFNPATDRVRVRFLDPIDGTPLYDEELGESDL